MSLPGEGQGSKTTKTKEKTCKKLFRFLYMGGYRSTARDVLHFLVFLNDLFNIIRGNTSISLFSD